MAEQIPVPEGEFVLYQTEDGQTRVECRFVDESLWLSQAGMADLFQSSKQNVAKHLKAIFNEDELDEDAVVNSWLTTAADGKRYRVKYYRLEAILAVGFRVRSTRGTQFRRWATERLNEYLVKGFTMDDERLKNPPVADSAVPDYFDDLLERIRDIRASERRMYLRVRDIFALAGDYDPTRKQTTAFFQRIQNKLHYAATGLTAPELIVRRADHTQPNMGLTSWRGDAVRKADAKVAKNYLTEEEISELNRIVVMWLDFAEDQARRRKQIFLDDWKTKLDEFLRFNDRQVLPGKGRFSRAQAKAHAEAEYGQFEARRRALLEAEGELQQRQALEQAAKELPKKNEDGAAE